MQLSGKKYKRKKSEPGRLWMGVSSGVRRKFYERDPDAKMPWSLDSHSRSLCFPLSRFIKYYLVFMTLKDTKFMQTLVNWGGLGLFEVRFSVTNFFCEGPELNV